MTNTMKIMDVTKVIENVETEQVLEKIITTIKKWGNSQGIRIPKGVMAEANLKEEDNVELSIYNGKIVIEKIEKPKYLNLKERMEAYYNQPIDDIYVESTKEVDTGTPKGNEIW